MSKFYTEPQKQIPIAYEVDVLVIGAGPAGVGAAIAAARSGVSTMLIEQAGDVGGVATTGLMSHWTGKATGPIYKEILERSSEGKLTINPEILKTELVKMLFEAGVKLRVYTFASDAIMDGDKITGVIVESKSGREAIMAKVVIDCSGDGDIAARAGAEFTKGRDEDGKMQPVTLMFKVAGVDIERAIFPPSFESNIEVPKGKVQDLAREHIPFPAGHVLLYRTTLPGVVTCNMTNVINIDGTNVDDLTSAHCLCRNQMESIIEFLHKFVPGYENCYIISSASIIGVRETRHFKGEKTLTEQDILEARVFEDWAVTKAHFNFDVHNISGSGLDKTGCQAHFNQPNYYTIPYGCFVPLKVDNLLLAGRNMSGTHIAHSSYRVMPICVNMGQATGTAAALCVKNQITPRQVDVLELQEKLKEQGVQI